MWRKRKRTSWRRARSRGARAAFGLAVVFYALTPTRLGPQDLASLLARQPGLGERWRETLTASPFGAIHAATFTFPRPLGTAMPMAASYRLASLDPDVTGAINARAVFDAPDVQPRLFPAIDRTRKGDRLPSAVEPDPSADADPPATVSAPATTEPGSSASMPTEPSAPPPRPGGKISVASLPPTVNAGDLAGAPAATPPASTEPSSDEAVSEPTELETDASTPSIEDDVSPAMRTASIYFGSDPLSGSAGFGTLQPWGPGQQPVFEAPTGEPDLPPMAPQLASLPDNAQVTMPRPSTGGETIAGKGEVTGLGRHPKSPAERLGLTGSNRAKHEKCLANAIYFESRGEAARGQIAVAQVVMNRVFSGYYPDNVCGVVYQNAHRHLACQFTFACDGIPDRVTEPDAWERAKTIARDTLDGKYWLDDVGKATHYHAYWVHPWWVRTMRKLDQIGVHTFYRPRKWGDGSDMPTWGDPIATKEAAKKL